MPDTETKPKTLLQLLFNSPHDLLERLNLTYPDLQGKTMEHVRTKLTTLHKALLDELELPDTDESYSDIKDALTQGHKHLVALVAFDQTKEATPVTHSYLALLFLIVGPYFSEQRQKYIAERWRSYVPAIQTLLEDTAEEIERRKIEYVIQRTMFGLQGEETGEDEADDSDADEDTEEV